MYGGTTCARSSAPQLYGDPGYTRIGVEVTADYAGFEKVGAALGITDTQNPAVYAMGTRPRAGLVGARIVCRLVPGMRRATA